MNDMSSSTGQAAQDPERRVIRIGGAEAVDEGTDADEGIWQTEGFDSAENPITVVIESIAAGRFELR